MTTQITEGLIADEAVSEPKLKDSAVTENKIADDSVSTDKYQDASITAPKLAPGVLSDGIVSVNPVRITAGGVYSKPSNLISAYVYVQGAGAGGGGTQSGYAAASGGGAGGCAERMFLDADLAANETVVIGSGGTGGAAGSSGSNGGDTTFLTLTGHGGGFGWVGLTGGDYDTPGGIGGTATGGAIGDGIDRRGNHGGPASKDNALLMAGIGGSSLFGGGGGLNWVSSPPGNVNGESGEIGAGGSGAVSSSSGRSGGAGGGGLVYIIEYLGA